ncbi:NAD(P)H-dependent oxidoreductase [Streptococcus caprae]|uniref:NAD(P)H-dependent oxidoreductase n=1 Tax=Streptococcus caprae TaxID=1640501 RepID=A0ABV8CUJ8_9STRE
MTNESVKQQVREAFDRRVAVRVYNDQTIPREDVEFILDTAWLSPSSVGLEGWRFLVLDREKIAELKSAIKDVAWGAQPQLDTASHFVILLAEKNARYDSQAIRESLIRRGLGEGEALTSRIDLYKSFQVRDMQMADEPRALWDWTAKQTYIALGNMMTTASLLGIDSCPIEGFEQTVVNQKLADLGWINPDKEAVATLLSLGYRLKDPKHPRSRKPRQEVVEWV